MAEINLGKVVGVPAVDNTTITANSNSVIQTVGVLDVKTNEANKFWTGTTAEYEALATKDPNTFYTITDGPEIPEATSQLINDSDFTTKTYVDSKPTILYGTGAPSASLGKAGDLYIEL